MNSSNLRLETMKHRLEKSETGPFPSYLCCRLLWGLHVWSQDSHQWRIMCKWLLPCPCNWSFFCSNWGWGFIDNTIAFMDLHLQLVSLLNCHLRAYVMKLKTILCDSPFLNKISKTSKQKRCGKICWKISGFMLLLLNQMTNMLTVCCFFAKNVN